MIHGLFLVVLLSVLALFGVDGAFEKLTKGCLPAIVMFLIYGGIIAYVLNGGLTEKSSFSLAGTTVLHISSIASVITLFFAFIIKRRGIIILSLICWCVFIACFAGRTYFVTSYFGPMSYDQYQCHLLGFKPPIYLW